MDAFAKLRERLAGARSTAETTAEHVAALEARVAETPHDITSVGHLVDIYVAGGRRAEAVDVLLSAAESLRRREHTEAALLLFDRAESLADATERVAILERTLPIHLATKSFVRAFHVAREVVEYRLSRGETTLAERFLAELPTLGERDAFLRKQLEALVGGAQLSRDPHGSWLTSGGLPRFPSREDFSDLTVLLVDDDAIQMTVHERALDPLGCAIIRAQDGAKALELIALQRPSLIISDLLMPDVDGSQLFERLRSDPSTESIPFVCVSSQTDEREIVAALIRGVEDYWEKPIRLIEFRIRVHRILRRIRNFPSLGGDLQEMSVPDVLQMLGANRRTGTLLVESAGRKATIYFMDGRPIDAIAGERVGDAAVYTLVSWTSGRFEFSSQLSDMPQRIFSSVEALLLEAMRRFDEEMNLVESLVDRRSLRTRLTAAGVVASPDAAIAAPEVARLRKMLDGSRTLDSILSELSGELESIQALCGWIEAGAIMFVEPA